MPRIKWRRRGRRLARFHPRYRRWRHFLRYRRNRRGRRGSVPTRRPCRARAAARGRSPTRWRRTRANRTLSSRGDTVRKAVADHLFRQFAADEDDAALARLAVLPFSLMIAFQHHVHALEHVAIVIAGEGKDALGAQILLAFAGDEVLQPRHEFRGVKRLV